MNHRVIDDKILFLLPIDGHTVTCGVLGSCPDNLRHRLEQAGITIVSLPQDDPAPSGCRGVGIDMLLFFQLPAGGEEMRRLVAQVAPCCSDDWSMALFYPAEQPWPPTLWGRVRRVVRTVSFVRRGRTFARSLGAASVQVLSVVPGFDAPGVLLDFDDSLPVNFARKALFNFLRAKSLPSRLLIYLLIQTGCVNYFIGDPFIVGTKNA